MHHDCLDLCPFTTRILGLRKIQIESRSDEPHSVREPQVFVVLRMSFTILHFFRLVRYAARTNTTAQMMAAFGFDCESIFRLLLFFIFIIIWVWVYSIDLATKLSERAVLRVLFNVFRCRQCTLINLHCFIFKGIISRHVWHSPLLIRRCRRCRHTLFFSLG